MRYCIVSSLTAAGCVTASCSGIVMPKPPCNASEHFTVGGNCLWSPAKTTRSALSMAIQHAASSACAASSIKSVWKRRPVITGLPAPVSVEAMTRALSKSAWRIRSSNSSARSRKRYIF